VNLTGASALVIGGAGGFGEATVRTFVEAGLKVVIADVADGTVVRIDGALRFSP